MKVDWVKVALLLCLILVWLLLFVEWLRFMGFVTRVG